MDRGELERKANSLGLPWSQATQDGELEALIRRAENEGSLAVLQRPECFGRLWDVPGSELCASECMDEPACFAPTAVNAVSEVLKKHFPDGDAVEDDLAVVMENSLESVRKMLAYRAAHPEEVAAAAAQEQKDPEAEPAQQNLLETPKPAPKGKKAAPKAKTGHPTEAGSAPAAGPAKRPPRRGRHHAGPALVQADDWDPQSYAARYEKERERSPLIGQLVPGMVLTRPYRGHEYQVRVAPNGYWLDGNLYPTLYKVTEAITGMRECRKQIKGGKRPKGTRKLCNWSASRFWGLEAQLKRLLLGRTTY